MFDEFLLDNGMLNHQPGMTVNANNITAAPAPEEDTASEHPDLHGASRDYVRTHALWHGRP